MTQMWYYWQTFQVGCATHPFLHIQVDISSAMCHLPSQNVIMFCKKRHTRQEVGSPTCLSWCFEKLSKVPRWKRNTCTFSQRWSQYRWWRCWCVGDETADSLCSIMTTVPIWEPLILTLSLQPSTLLCPLSFEPPTAPSLIPQQAHSPQERIRDHLKDSRLFLRVRASVLLSAHARNKWRMSKSYEGVEMDGTERRGKGERLRCRV